MNTPLTPVAPPPTERPALDLPPFPRWAIDPSQRWKCAKVGCCRVFISLELAPSQRWMNDPHWFAPCGHSVTAQRPHTAEVKS